MMRLNQTYKISDSFIHESFHNFGYDHDNTFDKEDKSFSLMSYNPDILRMARHEFV